MLVKFPTIGKAGKLALVRQSEHAHTTAGAGFRLSVDVASFSSFQLSV
jgi:hypothetical protein